MTRICRSNALKRRISPCLKTVEKEGLAHADASPAAKVCSFCVDKIEYIDYKDVNRLRRFVNERGKIMPRRMSGNCAKHQRQLSEAIKRARAIALMPFSVE